MKPAALLLAAVAVPAALAQRPPFTPPNCIYDSAMGATYDLGDFYDSFG